MIPGNAWSIELIRPAQPKRWFLRALQEEFDARQHPYGWDTPEFTPHDDWVSAMLLACPRGQATLVQFVQHDGFARPGCAREERPARSADSARPGDERVGQRPWPIAGR